MIFYSGFYAVVLTSDFNLLDVYCTAVYRILLMTVKCAGYNVEINIH